MEPGEALYWASILVVLVYGQARGAVTTCLTVVLITSVTIGWRPEHAAVVPVVDLLASWARALRAR